MAIAGGAGVFLSFTDLNYNLVFTFISVTGMIVVSYICFLGVYAWRRNVPASGIFLLAWVSPIFGFASIALLAQGLIEYSNLFYYSLGVGVLLEMALLSFALAGRINAVQLEKAQAQDRALTAEKHLAQNLVDTKARLEEQVRERTVQLETAIQEADEANRSKSEFLANMSHELRTPLNAIIGFSEIMEKQIVGPLGNEKYVDYASDIHGSGAHLLDIINDILDLSKIEAGAQELNLETFDVGELVEESVDLVRGRADQSGVTLLAPEIESRAQLNADRLRTKQILLNLLSNAVKFSDAGGTVEVYTRQTEAGEFEFRVADQGLGIASEDLEKVLLSFGQAADPTIRNQDGAGLGLPLSKALAELHGGSLEIESELGQGTTVTVRYPPERRANG